MKSFRISCTLIVFCVLVSGLEAEDSPFSFRDVAKEAGLLPALAGMNGHGAGWGDLDSDGFPELYVGGFDKSGEHPNVLFQNKTGKMFSRVESKPTRVTGRANSILFVDLDNDGDLDVYLSNLGGGKAGYAASDSRLLRNDGGPTKLIDISKASGACPPGFRGRGATAFDYDGDGLLDLLIGEAVHLGFHTLIARITVGNDISVRMCERSGFAVIGTMREVGNKFGNLLDVHILQKML